MMKILVAEGMSKMRFAGTGKILFTRPELSVAEPQSREPETAPDGFD
jgi:hypothetical protein